jgi:tetratricopeptide (TPR) repeat protein
MIEKIISNKYDSSYAEENILKARARWYNDHSDRGNQCKYFTLLIQKYSSNMDANNGDECLNNFMDCDLNLYCWTVFKYSVEKGEIDAAIKCMNGAIKRYKMRGSVPEGFTDTYANLLYKAGRLNEAIAAEEEEISNLEKLKADEAAIKGFRETLDKMKQGKPTWPHYIDKTDFFGMGLM